jgi:hypothetical protein
MPVTVKQIAEHLVAMDELEPAKARAVAREVIGVLGLCIDARNDEVYNPAPRPALGARTDNWRASMGNGQRKRR